MVKPKKSKKQTIGANLAKTFVITVINPILDGIETEYYWLDKKIWSWRFRTGNFEYLYPASAYVDIRFFANFEEFCKWYPQLAIIFNKHDQKLDEFAGLLNKAYIQLSGLYEFKEEFKKSKENWVKEGKNFRDVLGAYPEEDGPKVIIEKILNNTPELEPDVSTAAEFWNKHRNSFLKFQKHSELKSIIQEINSVRNEVIKIILELKEKLENLRSEYASNFDIPPVPIEKFEPSEL